jgi:hypothetical protein
MQVQFDAKTLLAVILLLPVLLPLAAAFILGLGILAIWELVCALAWPWRWAFGQLNRALGG